MLELALPDAARRATVIKQLRDCSRVMIVSFELLV